MSTGLTEPRNPPLLRYASGLARDLRRVVAGEVDFGPQARVLYAYDASVLQAAEDTLIVADGFSCRGQIRSGTGRRGLHLAQVLQLAYAGGRADHHVRRNALVSAGAIAAGAGLAAAIIRRGEKK